MPQYHIIWEIDLDADSPQAAARQAREHQTRPGTTATVFDVTEIVSARAAVIKPSARIDLLDLLDLDEELPDPETRPKQCTHDGELAITWEPASIEYGSNGLANITQEGRCPQCGAWLQIVADLAAAAPTVIEGI
jgi:hypothetical protein